MDKIIEILKAKNCSLNNIQDDFLEFQGEVKDCSGDVWNIDGSMEIDKDYNKIHYSIVFSKDGNELDGIADTVSIKDGDVEDAIDYIINPNFMVI